MTSETSEPEGRNPKGKGSSLESMIGFSALALVMLGFGISILVSPQSFSPETLEKTEAAGRRSESFLAIVGWLVKVLGPIGAGIVLCVGGLLALGVAFRRQIFVSTDDT